MRLYDRATAEAWFGYLAIYETTVVFISVNVNALEANVFEQSVQTTKWGWSVAVSIFLGRNEARSFKVQRKQEERKDLGGLIASGRFELVRLEVSNRA